MSLKLAKITVFIGFISIILGATACTPILYDHDLVGKVVDGETNEPIHGAVVLGKWNKWHASVAGRMSNFYDASETVTDENGYFEIEGKGLRLFSNITPMTAYIIKTPYNLKTVDYKQLVKNNGVVKLYEMTENQLLKYYTPSVIANVPLGKCKIFIKESESISKFANGLRKNSRGSR